MAYKDLQEFLRLLEKNGELKRIKPALDPKLEIAEITDRVSKTGGPALFFENPTGSKFPVVTNAFGSFPRMHLALECADLDALGRRIDDVLEMEKPQGLIEKLKLLPKLAKMAGIFPKTVTKAPCQDVVLTGDAVDLSLLPVLTTWPGDAGPFITLPVVVTRDPETGKRNVGMYRMQVFDTNTTGMHWHRHKGGASHYHEAGKRGERLPVAVASWLKRRNPGDKCGRDQKPKNEQRLFCFLPNFFLWTTRTDKTNRHSNWNNPQGSS